MIRFSSLLVTTFLAFLGFTPNTKGLLLYQYGPEHRDQTLDRTYGSYKLITSQDYPNLNFGGIPYDKLYRKQQREKSFQIDSRGIFWFGTRCSWCITKQNFPLHDNGYPSVSCFYSDIELEANPWGQAHFRVIDDCTDQAIYQSAFISRGEVEGLNGAQSCFGVIVTWTNATFSFGYEDTEQNTFQCGFLSVDNTAYSYHAYHDLSWSRNPWEDDGVDAMAGMDVGTPPLPQLLIAGSKTPVVANFSHLQLHTYDTGDTPQANVKAVPWLGFAKVKSRTEQMSTPVGEYKKTWTYQRLCEAHGDPHYVAFDVQRSWWGKTEKTADWYFNHFYNQEYATQHQPQYYSGSSATAWYLLTKTANCNGITQSNPYPAFAAWGALETDYGTTTQFMKLWLEFYFDYSDVGLKKTVNYYRNGKVVHSVSKFWKQKRMIFEIGHLPNAAQKLCRVCIKETGQKCDPAGTGENWQECSSQNACQVGTQNCPVYGFSTSTSSSEVTLSLSGDLGFAVRINDDGYFSLYVPDSPELSGNMVGHCGNNNGQQDDVFCPNSGNPGRDLYNSCWRADKGRLSTDGSPEDYFSKGDFDGPYMACPSVHATSEPYGFVVKETQAEVLLAKAALTPEDQDAQDACHIIIDKNGPFGPCQTLGGIQNFYESCVSDYKLTNGSNDVRCQHLSTVERLCKSFEPSVNFIWRKEADCPINCPPHSTYSTHNDFCEETCLFAKQPCPIPPKQGCLCDKGYVRDRRTWTCIPREHCADCIDTTATLRLSGSYWIAFSGTQNCTCQNRKVLCAPIQSGQDDKTMPVFKELKPNKPASKLTGACAKAKGFCQNGGLCKNVGRSFKCECEPNYKGERCEILEDTCAGSPCQSHEWCQRTTGGHVCRCPRGCKGKTCSEQIDYCKLKNCQNGARCVLRKAKSGEKCAVGADCICLPGFDGKRCEHKNGYKSG